MTDRLNNDPSIFLHQVIICFPLEDFGSPPFQAVKFKITYRKLTRPTNCSRKKNNAAEERAD
jgi:hypothetical protein